MDEAWSTVIAALGGALLGGLLTLAVGELQNRRADKAASKRDRQAAYMALLDGSMSFALRAQALGLTKRTRSGLAEGVAVFLGQRKPVDPIELYDWFTADSSSLLNATTRIQMVGRQAAINLSRRLGTACARVMAASLSNHPTRGSVVAAVAGAGWSDTQQRALDDAIQELGRARFAFLEVVRRELGEEPVRFETDVDEPAPRQPSIADGSAQEDTMR